MRSCKYDVAYLVYIRSSKIRPKPTSSSMPYLTLLSLSPSLRRPPPCLAQHCCCTAVLLCACSDWYDIHEMKLKKNVSCEMEDFVETHRKYVYCCIQALQISARQKQKQKTRNEAILVLILIERPKKKKRRSVGISVRMNRENDIFSPFFLTWC